MTNVAINGLGRIGRATMKIILKDSRFNLVAVNDILSTANLAYLLKYDTVYGRWEKSVTAGDMELRIGNDSLPVLGERDACRAGDGIDGHRLLLGRERLARRGA